MLRERIATWWRAEEAGVALISVLMLILMVGGLSVVLAAQAINQETHSGIQRREDVVIAGTEALLERYAAKMTVDPLYYLHRVDESERARVCTATGVTVEPGNPWDDTCTDWTYVDPADNDLDGEPDWFVHPLLEGGTFDPAEDFDDIAALIEVQRPDGATPLTVTVVGRQGDTVNRRAISASVEATSLSEFVRVTERNLSYGSGADVHGKVYSGGDLNFGTPAWARDEIYAEGAILNEPTFSNSAAEQAYDGAGEHNDIRSKFAQPLDFDNFWDDLQIIQTAACGGGGICLDDSVNPTATAWMVHPWVNGAGDGRIRVWTSSYVPVPAGCVNSEEFWYLYGQGAPGPRTFAELWTLVGDYDFPANGALWANQHVVVGNRTNFGSATDRNGDGFKDVIMRGSLTIYAGTSAAKKNVIINADTDVQDPAGYDTLGMIASDEIVINPHAVGPDRHFRLQASILGQDERWLVASTCGRGGGSYATPSGSTLDVYGSIATPDTGWISGHFSTRNYNFDERLRFLRPPLYPLLDADWHYENWKENPLPVWARP